MVSGETAALAVGAVVAAVVRDLEAMTEAAEDDPTLEADPGPVRGRTDAVIGVTEPQPAETGAIHAHPLDPAQETDIKWTVTSYGKEGRRR